MYKTKQKELVLQCLSDSRDKHMTAEEIYDVLAKSGNKVGMATIYRNLAILTNEGNVKKFEMTPTACYQYVENSRECENHYHLKCVKCNKLYHIESWKLDKFFSEDNDFCIDNEKTILYGKCKEC